MNAWLDGLSVLVGEWQLVLAILICVFTGPALTGSLLIHIFGGSLTSSERLALGLAGWAVPASLLSLIWCFTGFDGLFWILPAALILALLFRLKTDPKPAPVSTSLFLLLFLFLSILLRLAYASQATFPLYFDSAQHYSLIKGILASEASGTFVFSLTSYYHMGFHFLSAFIASITQAEITRVMLIFGQIILALIPFPMFFLVRHETKSDMSGWFALLLSAFGWYMPAHAVDWGKYPAMMSLGLIPFVLSLPYLIFQQTSGISVRNRWILYGILGISAVLSVFTHSRSLIILGIVFLAWVAVTWLEKRLRRWMSLAFLLVVIVTIVQVVFILRQDILVLLFDPYLIKGVPVTVLVLGLSILAWMVYPRLAFVSVLTMTLLFASLFVPVTIIPGYRDLTLLDRPFVEMILFLPLSLLGGLGLAGLEKKLQGRFSWGRFVGFLAIGIVVINALFTYDLYPSDCCVIVGNDDVAAMDWVADQLPVDARIGIASTTLKVMISDSHEGDVGADAGIWITPLTGRTTVLLPSNLDFSQRAAVDYLCQAGVSHLFLGEVGQVFDREGLNSRPEWYRPLLSMPKTGVYEVIGCD
jgi:hypothetical protein